MVRVRVKVKMKVIIYSGVLESIFSECDKFDTHETGGALLGTYQGSAMLGTLSIIVSGVIDAGPKARRTATSFFKDGEYQEKVFRQVERLHPEIEHLGNWHTHHVNGLQTLSVGDVETYHKNVNSENHNTDFWYALLVTKRLRMGRYGVKHFMLFRGDSAEYELLPGEIEVLDKDALVRRA